MAKYVGFGITILLFALTFFKSFGAVNEKAMNNEKRIKEVKEDTKESRKEFQEFMMKQTEIDTRQQTILESMDKMIERLNAN